MALALSTWPSALYQLVRQKLGQDPIEFIKQRRGGDLGEISYARISDEVKRTTGLYVTPEALRRWHIRPEAEATPPPARTGD